MRHQKVVLDNQLDDVVLDSVSSLAVVHGENQVLYTGNEVVYLGARPG